MHIFNAPSCHWALRTHVCMYMRCKMHILYMFQTANASNGSMIAKWLRRSLENDRRLAAQRNLDNRVEKVYLPHSLQLCRSELSRLQNVTLIILMAIANWRNDMFDMYKCVDACCRKADVYTFDLPKQNDERKMNLSVFSQKLMGLHDILFIQAATTILDNLAANDRPKNTVCIIDKTSCKIGVEVRQSDGQTFNENYQTAADQTLCLCCAYNTICCGYRFLLHSVDRQSTCATPTNITTTTPTTDAIGNDRVKYNVYMDTSLIGCRARLAGFPIFPDNWIPTAQSELLLLLL